ncbi:hypothetical protein [Roseibium algae]|uniref:Uncharacterized protein n=1 Tax=Roseibium algae TaxID=3123038 RepID=A0ABU8TN83_9HYPH
MRRLRTIASAVVCIVGAGLFTAANVMPSHAVEVYDLLFKNGTLDDMSQGSVLEYDRTVSARDNEELGAKSTGTIRLSIEPEDMAGLQFVQGEKFRKIGEFPSTVGNPMIMYFVETVIRDMAGTAGGSPYYIRNRVKAALIEDAPIVDAVISVHGKDVKAQAITLYPFKNDPNRARMKGFGDLALTITMSADVPGWYYSLKADTDAAGADSTDAAPAYFSEIVLAKAEAIQ